MKKGLEKIFPEVSRNKLILTVKKQFQEISSPLKSKNAIDNLVNN
jgi:hypothetical protein